MKTNRKDFTVKDMYGERIYTKKQANKKNRKNAKKLLTSFC